MKHQQLDASACNREQSEVKFLDLCRESADHPMYEHGFRFRNAVLGYFHQHTIDALEVLRAKSNARTLDESGYLVQKFEDLTGKAFNRLIDIESVTIGLDLWETMCEAAGIDPDERLSEEHFERLKPFAVRIPLGLVRSMYVDEEARWCFEEAAIFWELATRVLSVAWRTKTKLSDNFNGPVKRNHAMAHPAHFIAELTTIEVEIAAFWNTNFKVDRIASSKSDLLALATAIVPPKTRTNETPDLDAIIGKLYGFRNADAIIRLLEFMGSENITEGRSRWTRNQIVDMMKSKKLTKQTDFNRAFGRLDELDLIDGLRGDGFVLTALGLRVFRRLADNEGEST